MTSVGSEGLRYVSGAAPAPCGYLAPVQLAEPPAGRLAQLGPGPWSDAVR